MNAADNTFLFDDFFVGDDGGVEIRPIIRGRVVPMRVKRGIQFADRTAAQNVAVKTHLDPTGKVEIDGIDNGLFTLEVLSRTILSWPFTYGPKHPQAGQPVPVNKDNICKMVGAGVDAIMLELQQLEAGQQAALVPSESPSEEA